MNYFSIVLEQLLIFIVYMLTGIIAVKTNVLNREKLNTLSSLITKIFLPLLVFTNTINGTTREQFISSAVIIPIALVLYLFLYLLAFFLAKIMRLKGNREKVYRACTMFGNCGFMGIPIISALFEEQGGLYIAIYTVVDQLILWTIGTDLIAPVSSENTTAKERIKKMINPATVAVLLGVFFVLTGLKLPSVISNALTKTGASASPLAMIYLGGVFYYIDIRSYLKKKEIYLMIFVKMILAPVLVYMVLHRIPLIDNNIAVTISILCGLPTMSSVAMMAENMHSDSDYCAGMIFVTTILSIVTLPAVCALF